MNTPSSSLGGSGWSMTSTPLSAMKSPPSEAPSIFSSLSRSGSNTNRPRAPTQSAQSTQAGTPSSSSATFSPFIGTGGSLFGSSSRTGTPALTPSATFPSPALSSRADRSRRPTYSKTPTSSSSRSFPSPSLSSQTGRPGTPSRAPSTKMSPSASTIPAFTTPSFDTILSQAQNPLFLSELHTSGKYSDLLIKCQGRSWKVHRAIVCSQSKPFEAAMNGNFRESATGEIDLEEEEPEIVHHMIDFFYTGDYNDSRGPDPIIIDAISPVRDVESPLIDPYYLVTSSGSTPATPSSASNLTAFGTAAFEDPSPSPLIYLDDESTSLTGGSMNGSSNGSSGGSSSPTPSDSASTGLFDSPLMNNAFNNSARAEALLINAKVYILAEKYDIQPLKLYSTQKYKSLLPGTMSSSCFVESLEMIYDGTPDRVGAQELLREVVINAASERAKDLLEREDFYMLCKDRGDIATDLLMASMRPKAPPSPLIDSRKPLQEINANTQRPDPFAYRGFDGYDWVANGQ